ncbi:MAG TPA: phosphodiester glycosidase family protein [Thermoanaerobaculia bacterium]|nr:phosphodiester glycosidase family protein [Thermoanaerobaculia bacterium]
MKLRKLLPALVAALLAACVTEKPAPRAAESSRAAPVAPGIEVKTARRASPVPLVTYLVTVDLARAPGPPVVVADRDAEGNLLAATTSELARRHALLVAVNASFFEVPFGIHRKSGERSQVVGALVLDGKPVPSKAEPLALIDGALCIDGRNIRIEKGFECRGAAFGLASGPVLILGGQRQDTAFADAIFKSPRHPRTAVGVDAAKRRLWLLVADGRQPGVSEGATLDELKDLLAEAGATDALNLDGGGSSTLVARDASGALRVLNVPIHDRTPGLERAVVTAVGVKGERR